MDVVHTLPVSCEAQFLDNKRSEGTKGHKQDSGHSWWAHPAWLSHENRFDNCVWA